MFFFCFIGFFSSTAQVNSDSLVLFAEATENKLPCHQDTTDITVTAYDGRPPYLMDWENTTTGDTGQLTIASDWFFVTIEPARGGLYRLRVMDADNEIQELALLISEPEPIEFQIETTKASCPESMDATAHMVELSGGTVVEDYQVTWLTLPTQHELIANNLGVGIQTVVVTDDKDCTLIDTIRVEAIAEMQLQDHITHVTCADEQNGKIELNVQGGTAPYTYQWSENTNSSQNKNLAQLAGGAYEITITDASTICQLKDSFWVEEPPSFDIEWTIHAPICHEEVGAITIESVQNAVPPVYYSMNNLGFHSETMFGGILPGPHTLYFKDANGCRTKKIFDMPPPNPIVLDLGSNPLIILGDSTLLQPFQSTSFVTYDWQPTHGLSCSDCPMPMAQPQETTTYSLVATDSTGCTTVDEITVLIQKNRSVYIPTVFSPNNGGFNDSFVVFGGQEVRFLKGFRIYNRWGSLIFELAGDLPVNHPDFGWNGQFRGQLMPAGTYLYQAEVEFLDGEILPYLGEVYLMR